MNRQAKKILDNYKDLFIRCSMVCKGSIIPEDLLCSHSLSQLGSEMLKAIELLDSDTSEGLEGQYQRRKNYENN